MSGLLRSVVFRSHHKGVITRTTTVHYQKAHRQISPSRMAKADQPWWFRFVVSGGTVVALNVCYFSYSWIHQWRATRLFEKKELLLLEDMTTVMQANPKLAAAAVQMVCHYLWSQVSTPFGAPMVASPFYQEEAMKLKGLVEQWQKQFPQLLSVADLWTLVSITALASVGGPRLAPTVGRVDFADEKMNEPVNENPSADGPHVSIQIIPSFLDEQCRNVRDIKHLLVKDGHSLTTMVALFGLTRFIGLHPYDKVAADTPNNAKRLSFFSKKKAARTSNAASYDLYQCSSTPFHFSNEYFRLLLDCCWVPEENHNKKQVSSLSISSSSVNPLLFRSKDTKRLSSESCRSSLPSSLVFNGESNAKVRSSSAVEIEENASGKVRMNEVDVSLLNDLGTHAILKRFANSEKLLDYVIKNLFFDILLSGHNANRICELRV